MKTLNQIKHDLINFFEGHAIINQVVYSNDFEFNAERELNYPVANIEYLESNMNGKLTTHSYSIILADLYDNSLKGHSDEIHSDMLLIAEDFFSWAQEEDGFLFNKAANIQKFIDDADDRTAGIVLKFQLATMRSQNSCAIPFL